jgi:histidinol dehydrogenase
MIRILESSAAAGLLRRRAARFSDAEAIVRPILEDVRKRGDKALLEYARKFDRLERKSVAVPQAELDAAAGRLSPQFRGRADLGRQRPRLCEAATPGGKKSSARTRFALSQIVLPLDSVAAYIPSGRYPLPSTVIMTVVPAKVAGVPNIMVATPRPVDEIFGTASMLGGSRVRDGRRAGHRGVRLGTRTVPRADRIVGPGNIYVAAAKKLLAGEVGIDFVAGPTEILIIASEGIRAGLPPTCWLRPSTTSMPRPSC